MQIYDDTALTFPRKLNSQATGATFDGDAPDASLYLSILWCYSPICSPPFELTCRDRSCREDGTLRATHHHEEVALRKLPAGREDVCLFGEL